MSMETAGVFVDPRDGKGQFVLGHTGLPGGGRPRGSRNKFATELFDDFYANWQRNGARVIEQVAQKNPVKYLAIAASLIPQHVKLEVEHTIAGMSEEELRSKLLESQAKLLEAGIDERIIDVTPVEVK